MPIPKKIIQTSRSSLSLSRVDLVCQETLSRIHPDYEMLFFSASERREFVRENGDGLVDLYDHLPRESQKTDLFAMLSVYVLGGFFLHTDIQTHERFDPLLNHSLVLTEERILSQKPTWYVGAPGSAEELVRIGSYAFGAEEGSWFLDEALCELTSRTEVIRGGNLDESRLEYTSAADVFSYLYHIRKTKLRERTCILSGSHRGRWSEFGEFGSHILSDGF